MKVFILCFLAAVLASPLAVWASSAQQADLIVYGDYVLTMDEAQPQLRDGAVVVQGDQIVDVGPRARIDAGWRAVSTISGAGRVLMPGLVNGHTHSAMTLFRGMVDDLDLMTWLNQYVFPMEGRFVTPEFVRVGAQLACWEMIRGGTTTFVDMYFYPDEIATVVERCGLRAVVGAPHIDYPSPGFSGWDDSFAAADEFVQRWQGKHTRITPAFAPHAPYTVSPEHLQATVEKAAARGAPISMHLAEAPSERDYVLEQFDTSPVQHVAGLGMFSSPLIAAHMVQLDPRDIALTASAGVGAIHNPTSNMKLGAGIAPVSAMLAAGVNVGLGTDGAASNNDLDLWEEVRMAALLHKVISGDPTALPASQALAMATRLGAAAIHKEGEIGQLKAGMQADMIQLDVSQTHQLPLYDVQSHLVYVLGSDDVQTTIVAGKVLMQDRKVLTIDEQRLRADVTQISGRIREALQTGQEDAL